MKTPKIAKAIGFIDDDLIAGAIDYRPKAKNPWAKILAAAASLCFVAAVLLALPDMGASAEDPNWHKTHFETESAEVMSAICGENLLLDKLAVKEVFYSEYILEIRKGGSFTEKSDFCNLSARINYGESVIDSDGEQVYCYISFDRKAEGTYIDEYFRNGEFETKEMTVNGYTVRYAKTEPLSNINTQRIIAKFEYGGYDYYLETESPDKDFFEKTLENMLG